jgi:hypothetical protein
MKQLKFNFGHIVERELPFDHYIRGKDGRLRKVDNIQAGFVSSLGFKVIKVEPVGTMRFRFLLEQE